jgi:two-component system sensor histidine kinase/response regulator
VHFSVSDTGIGISQEWKERIFGAFVQADGSHARRYGGTGLGLSISLRLVGFMGGRMWVDSEVGRGSTFHFTVDLGVPDPPATKSRTPEPEGLHDLAVLVVDDNATNRRILKETLLCWHMRPVLAESGQEALELVHRHAGSGDRFALILLDAQMPGMDGLTVARQIRQNPSLADPQIMMLSSLDLKYLSPELRDTSHYVTKPVTRQTLLKAILKVFQNGPKPSAAPRSTRPAGVERLHILLTEDNVVNQKVVARLLEKQGHTVFVSSNGPEALLAFSREAFDLILMDVQMPGMNGYATTQAIREHELGTGRHTPIIALTAHALKGDREICLEAGMDDYLGKPVHLEELIAVLARWGKHDPAQMVEEAALPRI